jgi:hypothetical protein
MRRVLLNQIGSFISIMVISSKQGKLSTSPAHECTPGLQGNDSAECLSSHRNLCGRELLTPDFHGAKCERSPRSPISIRPQVLAPGADGTRPVSRLRRCSLFIWLYFLLARIQLLVLNKRPNEARLGFYNLCGFASQAPSFPDTELGNTKSVL